MAKDFEAELQANITQDWIQDTLQASQVGFWRLLVDKESGKPQLFVDENLKQSMGFPDNTSAEETFAFWDERVLDAERKHLQKTTEQVSKNANKTYEIEYLWKHPLLGVVPVRAVSKAFQPSLSTYYGVEGYQMVLHAVERVESSLQRSYQYMQTMFDATPVGIALWDLKFNLLDCNPKFLQLLGAKSVDFLAKNFEVFSPKYQPCGTESSEKIKEIFVETKSKGRCNFEWMHKCAKGEAVPCDVTLTLTKAYDQEIYMAFLRDLSAEKQIIKKLAERQAQLHEALVLADDARHAKNIFFANISHEIRTPMNAIMGMSYLCLQLTNDNGIRHYLENIRNAGESLLNVINDVLDISKIEAGKLELEHAPFNMSKLLENISSTVSSLASDKPIEFLFNIDPRLPTIFVGDAIRLGQVLTNLFSNAIKFTQQGHIVLRMALKAKKGTLCTLGIEVMDTGIGMDKNHLKAIFRPFEQAEQTITRRFGGTGLGLTISKNIVELMGGNISVRSEEGVGTVFSFEVSLLHRREESWINTALAKKEKILIIDDSFMACAVLKEMLEMCSFQVDAVNSCHEGCALLQKADMHNPYSLVIIDWKMPGMSGIDCALKIKDLELSKTPALVLTSGYSPHVFTEEWTDHFASFISKPVLPIQLWSAIMKALNIGNTEKIAIKEEDCCRFNKLSGRKVLLTEDNEINQEIAIALLEELGMNIVVAENGQEALNACKRQFFDVILMDIQMPIMDGLTATQHIRDLEGYGHRQIPIIAMTAHAMQVHKEQSFNAGMNDHLTKPIDPNLLREVLYKWTIDPDSKFNQP